MIGKTIAGSDSLTEKSSEQKNGRFKTIDQVDINLDNTKWDKFQQEIKTTNNDTIKIKTTIDDSGLQQLKDLSELYDYAVKRSKSGEDIKIDDINSLIQNQEAITSQAHGLSGVNKAIKEYNKATDKSSRSKFAEAISQSNTSLGDYLKGLNGASGGLAGYAGSLAAASLKTIGLRAATMALNAAVSFGTSVLIESLIGGISYLINYEEKQKEAFENAKRATEENAKAVRSLRSEMSDTSSKASGLSSEYATLVQGVNPLTNENESLSTEDYERFLEVSNELAELFPSLTHNYDENGNAILGLSGDVDTVTASIERLVEQQNHLAKADMREHLEEYINGTKDTDGVFEVLKGNKKEVTDAERELNSLTETYKGMINQVDGKYFGSDKNAYNDYLNDVKSKFGQEAYDALFGATVYGEWVSGSNTYSIDFSKLELDDSAKEKITSSYNTFYQDLQTTLSIKQSELESKNEEISDTMMVWVEDIGLYKDGTPAFKRAIETMVGSIQWSDLDLDEGNLDEAKQFIQDIILNPLTKACDDPGSKLKITDALNSLFTLDFSGFDYKEADEKIKGFLTVIMNAFNTGKPDAEKKNLTDMYDMFHLENYKETSDKMANHLAFIATGGSGLLGLDPVDYGKLVSYTKDFTQSQAEAWLTATDGAKSAEEAIRLYEKSLGITTGSQPGSFKHLWDSIGTTGDETADKKAIEAKEKLEELADAGRLTEEALKDSGLAEFFDKSGVSIEEATNEINAFVEETKHLSTMSSGIKAITSAYDEKKDSNTNTVSAPTLESMESTLGTDSWTGKDKKVWEHYKTIASDGKKSLGELKEAQDELAGSYVNSNNFLANLSDENHQYYAGLLNEMGIINAEAVALDALNRKKADTKMADFDLSTATSEEIASFGNYITSLEGANSALGDYIIKKQLAGGANLSTSDSIQNLIDLATQCGATSDVLIALKELLDATDSLSSTKNKSLSDYNISAGTDLKHAYDDLNNQKDADIEDKSVKVEKTKNKLKKLIKGAKTAVETTGGNKTNTSPDGSNKAKSEKQSFNWLERRLTRMQNIIDFTSVKLQNLFSVKAKNKNLNTQIKQTVRLMKQYGTAAKKYQKQADQIAKDLPKDVVNKIRSGKLTKENTQKLFRNYKQSDYDKINKYLDSFDKAQESKKNRAEQKAKIRELKKNVHQNSIDQADSYLSLYEQKKENGASAEEKNSFLEKEVKWYNKSYKHQIAIAKLEGNKTEQKRLQAELDAKLRDLEIEKHQNLADEYQSTLDRYSAEKELAVKASDKNSLIEQEKAATQALYAEKIAIAGLEGSTTEQYQYQAQLKKTLRDLEIEQHQNLADQYQAELDRSSAEKANQKTADAKNKIVEQEKVLTSQLYAEKIAIAHIEGNISEEQRLQEELTRQMVVLEKERFDNITHYYENLMKVKNNSYTDLSNAVSELEARGLIASSQMYASQIAINNDKKKMYEEELFSLNTQLHSIEQNTDEWYEALDAIQSCENSIAECAQDSYKLAEGIRQVNLQLSNKITTRFEQISSEYDLMIKLMSNKKLTDEDTGSFTKEGTATLGAYYSQLILVQKEAETFKNFLDDMWDKIQRKEEGYTEQTALDEYYEKYDEYTKMIASQYDIQQSLIDLMKEKYKAELDYLKDIIDRRKELLQAEKDEYDYRRTIEEKTKNIRILAKQVSALSGDDSEAAKAKLQQLRTNLDEAQKDLQDTEYDKWISDQQKMLDNLYNEYESFIDDKLNDVDALLQEAVTYLSDINIGQDVADVLQQYADTYRYDPTADLENINTALGENGSIVTAVNGISNLISHYFNQQLKDTEDAGKVIKLISGIGQVDIDGEGYKRLEQAKEAYRSLSKGAKRIVDSASVNGLSTLQSKHSEWETLKKNREEEQRAQRKAWEQENDNRIKQEQEALRNRQREVLTDAIKRTYGANANEYASPVVPQITSSYISIVDAIQRNGLQRNDPYISPNDAAIHKIVQMINTAGLGVTIDPTADALWQYMQNIGFSHGGIADTLQKIPSINGDDGWITVKRGEAVLTPGQTKAFRTLTDNLDILNPSVDLLAALSKPPATSFPKNSHSSTQIGEVDFHFELPNVVDSDSFIREMQTNPKVEKVIKTMLWDKNSLSKHRI